MLMCLFHLILLRFFFRDAQLTHWSSLIIILYIYNDSINSTKCTSYKHVIFLPFHFHVCKLNATLITVTIFQRTFSTPLTFLAYQKSPTTPSSMSIHFIRRIFLTSALPQRVADDMCWLDTVTCCCFPSLFLQIFIIVCITDSGRCER